MATRQSIQGPGGGNASPLTTLTSYFEFQTVYCISKDFFFKSEDHIHRFYAKLRGAASGGYPP